MDIVKGRLKDILICLAIFCLGFLAGYYKAPTKIVYRDSEPRIITQTKTKTEVQYIEKESPKDADVEITNENPTVSIDGKKFEMKKLPTEKTKFDQGKVTVEQGYEIKIDASQVVPKTPKFGLDVGYSNHGIKTGLEYNFNRNVAAYVEGTLVPKEGRDRYYGVGVKVRF